MYYVISILCLIFLPAATKLGQGNIFTSVCQEFCPQGGRVSASVHAGIHPLGADIPPGADTPPEQTPPQSRHPRSRHSPRADPPEQTLPQSRPPRVDTPQEQTTPLPPPRADPPPPGKQTAAYGQRAAGTHPTGMHSCYFWIYLCNPSITLKTGDLIILNFVLSVKLEVNSTI